MNDILYPKFTGKRFTDEEAENGKLCNSHLLSRLNRIAEYYEDAGCDVSILNEISKNDYFINPFRILIFEQFILLMEKAVARKDKDCLELLDFIRIHKESQYAGRRSQDKYQRCKKSKEVLWNRKKRIFEKLCGYYDQVLHLWKIQKMKKQDALEDVWKKSADEIKAMGIIDGYDMSKMTHGSFCAYFNVALKILSEHCDGKLPTGDVIQKRKSKKKKFKA